METCATYCSPKQGIDARWSDYALRRISSIVYGENLIDSSKKIFIRGVSKSNFQKIIDLPAESIEWVSKNDLLPSGANLDIPQEVPVLFRAEGSKLGDKIIEKTDDEVYFNLDFVAATFFMLTRWEETIVAEKDEHERFSFTASVAYKQGFLHRPIIDEYALILRAWIKYFYPKWQEPANNFQVHLSHDIDFLVEYPSIIHVIVACWNSFKKYHNMEEVGKTLSYGFRRLLSKKNDKYIMGSRRLMDLSEHNGLSSTFYFMTASRTPYNQGYNPQKLKYIIKEVIARKHKVGIHPGYQTYNNSALLKKEKEKLDSIFEFSSYGSRQHYLRFKVPETWRYLERCDIKYDSSMGYNGHEGFRCGTCHPFPPYDIEYNREFALIEIPLLVVDKTLKSPGCRGMKPEEGKRQILYYAERCQKMGGIFTLLWHNISFEGDWEPWANMYEDLLPTLAKMQRIL